MELRDQCVYCHTNKINGKKYIGRTNNTKRRWRGGGIEYKPDKNGNENVAFWNAIQKYGWDNFEHEVLISNLTLDESKEIEKYYIKYYQTFIGFYKNKKDRKGYNSTLGGEGTKGLCGKLHPNYGKKMTPERIDFFKTHNSRAINEFLLDGTFVKKWDKEKDVVDNFGIDYKSLWEVLHGKRKTRCNRVFRYLNDDFDKYNVEHLNMAKENHPMYGRNHTEYSKRAISLNRRGKATGSNNHMSKCTICDENIFQTIKECAEYLQIPYPTLQCWLNGRSSMPEVYRQRGLRIV